MHAAYGAAHALGITVDIVAAGADLSAYKLVIIPTLYLVTDADAANITGYIAGGGTALITFFSGIVDEDDRVRAGGYPGAFRESLGIRVEEFSPLAPEHRVKLDSGATASLWAERLQVTSAEIVARYLDGPLPGVPAITRNRFGTGDAWYLATALDAASYQDLLGTIADAAGLGRRGLGSSVEIVRRASATDSFLFVINHGQTAIDVAVAGQELITGTRIDASVQVAPGAVRVIREDRAIREDMAA
jgi:beta-galactosidase